MSENQNDFVKNFCENNNILLSQSFSELREIYSPDDIISFFNLNTKVILFFQNFYYFLWNIIYPLSFLEKKTSYAKINQVIIIFTCFLILTLGLITSFFSFFYIFIFLLLYLIGFIHNIFFLKQVKNTFKNLGVSEKNYVEFYLYLSYLRTKINTPKQLHFFLFNSSFYKYFIDKFYNHQNYPLFFELNHETNFCLSCQSSEYFIFHDKKIIIPFNLSFYPTHIRVKISDCFKKLISQYIEKTIDNTKIKPYEVVLDEKILQDIIYLLKSIFREDDLSKKYVEKNYIESKKKI